MQRRRGIVLTAGSVAGLLMLYRYRFLGISQFARSAGFSLAHAKAVLRNLADVGMVGFIGYTLLPGIGRTPKVYYLTRKGFEILREESGGMFDAVFQEVKSDVVWSPVWFHRLALIDLFVCLEGEIVKRPHLKLLQTFLEYRRKGERGYRETADYVAEPHAPENRLIPDGAFILENTQSKRRVLFFIEMDMGTERLTAPQSRDREATIKGKFAQYDRYLTGGTFATTYATYGEFRSFLMLFVIVSSDRMENIRVVCQNLSNELHSYYRLTTRGDAQQDIFGPIWKSRDAQDTRRYALVAQSA